jgi:hypothetical protein
MAMTPEQGREYIAEKILVKSLKKQYVGGGNINYFYNHRFVFSHQKDKEKPNYPDFEFLPEWTGPICEVVLPMLAELGWMIGPLGKGLFCIARFHPGGQRLEFPILQTKGLQTILVDAHIKITGEKGE